MADFSDFLLQQGVSQDNADLILAKMLQEQELALAAAGAASWGQEPSPRSPPAFLGAQEAAASGDAEAPPRQDSWRGTAAAASVPSDGQQPSPAPRAVAERQDVLPPASARQQLIAELTTALGGPSPPDGGPALDLEGLRYEGISALVEAVGSVANGLSMPALERLQQTSTFSFAGGHTGCAEARCVVCQCEYEPDEQLLQLPCSHSFHTECISHWLSTSKACPICSSEVPEQLPQS